MGASCLVDTAAGVGACGVDADLGCETGVGRECPSGLVCAADRCERSCRDATDCPDDGECRPVSPGGVSFCFDARSAIDAGAIDAGTIDAETSDAPVVDAADGSIQTATVRQVCFEYDHAACALLSTGRVVCWGDRHNGALGDGSSSEGIVSTPVEVVDDAGSPLVDVESLACGAIFGCAYVASGSASPRAGHVLCWGYSEADAWGIGGTAFAATDLTPALRLDVARLSAAHHHACALNASSGTLSCWGLNEGLIDLTLATSTPFPSPTPPAFTIPDIAEVGVAAGGACVIHGATREVTCWGENDTGQAGVSPVDAVVGAEALVAPQLVRRAPSGTLADAYVLAVGWRHRAVLVPGALYTWGWNLQDELGEPEAFSGEACDDTLGVGAMCRSVATVVTAPDFSWIATNGSGATSCGIDSITHRVQCWGDNSLGRCGIDPVMYPHVDLRSSRPVLVEATGAPLADVADASVWVGDSASCAARRDGTLWCWGANARGQLARTPDTAPHMAAQVVLP